MSRTPLAFLCALVLALNAAGAARAQEPAQPRNVSPPWLTRAERPGPPMHSRDPDAVPALIPVVAPPKPQDIRVTPKGALTVDGTEASLAGVALPDRKMICKGSDGVRWSCGAAAYVAWVNMLRAKNVVCDVDKGIADCKMGDRSVAKLLAAAGWAVALSADGEVKEAEDLAKSAHSGIYGDPP